MKRAKATQLAAASTPEPLNPARLVEADLAAVEAKLSRLLDSKEPIIAEICHYLVDAGGKRLRPTFIMLVYRACGGPEANADAAIDAAIALELIHSATLLHDDIIDAGMLRRGQPSAFARYGAGGTLIAGDYLFCRAFELCGRFEEHLVRTAAQACIQLTEGEVMEGRFRHSAAANFNDYLTVITRKTASLFSAGGRVAADLAGAPKKTVESMWNLGVAVGRAFQMVDDILDITGPEEKIGKPVGSDLRAGIPSLPVVLGMTGNPEVRLLFENDGRMDGARFERALELLRAPDLIAEARAMAAEQVKIARGLLAELRPSEYRTSLTVLIEDQIDREV